MTERHDPLDALRVEYTPVAPDVAFAARLRVRIELALLSPRRTAMTSSTEQTEQIAPAEQATRAEQAAQPVTVDTAEPAEGDVVYSSLWLPDADRAEAFYGAALGWRFEPGSSRRARMLIGVTPPRGLWGNVPDATLYLCHAVDDVHAAVARIRAAGGTADEPAEQPFGLAADCVDNQGMRFTVLNAPRAERRSLPEPGAAGLLYLTVGVPDSALYRDFYGAVFGWTFTPGRIDDGWGVQGPTPMTGMHGGADRPAVLPMYGVPDVAAAVRAVRAAGGTATEPEQMPYGTTSDCVDDQGVRFYLGQI